MLSRLKKNLFLLPILLVLLIPISANSGSITDLKVAYDPQAFTSPVAQLNIAFTDAVNLPWSLEALSPAYDYSFSNFGFYDPSRLLEIKIYYTVNSADYKRIFSYDAFAKTWQPLDTTDYPEQRFVVAKTNSTSGQVIVLSSPKLMTVGTASWYAFRGGDFAASPDFAKGSVLRVHNLDNGKTVDVTINDWGPERDKHPDRVIDLDKVAFSKIASPSVGLIRVKIEPIKIVVSEIAAKTPQLSDQPNVTADSAIIMLEKTGEVIWGKNQTQASPLASLTKLVAIKVFLDTKPTMNQVVTYKYQDEKYNHQYCKPWESARLRVSEGETLTVEDLIYSSLVGSANNTVETLVRVSGLTRDQFVAKMNEAVQKWGTKATHFTEPTGLSPENVSSPLDYAIITREVLSNPLIKKISSTYRYEFSTINTKKYHRLTNTNPMIKNNEHSLVGSKTGYLDEAGYCLMTMAKTDQGNLIIINFNSKSKAENFLDNEQLIHYGQKVLQSRK